MLYPDAKRTYLKPGKWPIAMSWSLPRKTSGSGMGWRLRQQPQPHANTDTVSEQYLHSTGFGACQHKRHQPPAGYRRLSLPNQPYAPRPARLFLAPRAPSLAQREPMPWVFGASAAVPSDLLAALRCGCNPGTSTPHSIALRQGRGHMDAQLKRGVAERYRTRYLGREARRLNLCR